LSTRRTRAKDGVRSAGDPATAVVGGVLKGIGAALGVLEGLFSAPKPPTPEQAKQNARGAAEQDRQPVLHGRAWRASTF
jgi:hypothetical protein